MRILSRYIAIAVVSAILLVLLVIVSIDAIGAIIDGMGDLTKAFTFKELLVYVGLTLPARLYENLPMASLIGCLIGLGMLGNNSELVVMRASGVSLLRIVWYVAKPVMVLVVLGALMGEYLVPITDQYADSRRMMLKAGQTSQETKSGLWNKEGNDFLHFNAVYPGGVLYGVTRYHFDEQHRLLEASFAKRAAFQGEHWLEEKGVITRFLGDKTTTDSFVSRKWETDLSPDLLHLVASEPESLAMRSLYGYSRYLDDQGQKSDSYRLAFWRKALQPFIILSLVLIAISFVFGPLRQVTMGYRIFTGVVVGLVFRTSQDLLGPASLVFGFSPFLGVFIPGLICALIGIYLLKRAA